MRGNKRTGTKPELTVRRALHALGFRFRLHGRDLPGKPDIVFRSRRKAIFVHGCFWHQHPDSNCPLVSRPQTNSDYWQAKLTRNVERDAENRAELSELGWSVMIVWECELNDLKTLTDKLVQFLKVNA